MIVRILRSRADCEMRVRAGAAQEITSRGIRPSHLGDLPREWSLEHGRAQNPSSGNAIFHRVHRGHDGTCFRADPMTSIGLSYTDREILRCLQMSQGPKRFQFPFGIVSESPRAPALSLESFESQVNGRGILSPGVMIEPSVTVAHDGQAIMCDATSGVR